MTGAGSSSSNAVVIGDCSNIHDATMTNTMKNDPRTDMVRHVDD